MPQTAPPALATRRLTILLAVGCAVSVANMYFCQPLLADMAAGLPGGHTLISYVPTFTQIGTMLGMGLFVPLGDMLERRALIVYVSIAVALMAGATALAPNARWLAVASFLLGLTSIVPHLILPFVAQLSAPEQRGRAVGTVLSGLLIGILCARTFSGFLGAWLGWRSVYWAGLAGMTVLAWLLRLNLPTSKPAAPLTYPQLLRSIWSLVRESAQLREAALIGAMTFGAFSAFWATLIFRLVTPPYHLGARAAGLFGLVGAAGAAAAPLIGRLADRRGPRATVGYSLLLTALSFLIFLLAGHWIAGLIAGVVLMDLGVQASHVSNQTRIYAIRPEARSRLNTVYMVSYFLGGALGSSLGAYAWHAAGWTGVSLVGLAMVSVALVVHFRRGTLRFSA